MKAASSDEESDLINQEKNSIADKQRQHELLSQILEFT
jgi:hypothetical protein